MSFCLPKVNAEKFISALKDGTIDVDKMATMSSEERRNFLADIVGEKDAKEVNALYESKLLLKDQQRGLVTWAKKVAGLTESARTDLLSRIEKLDHVLTAEDKQSFLEDYVDQKLGVGVTFEEAKNISEMAQKAEEAKAQIPADSPDGSPEREAYGNLANLVTEYVSELKGESQKMTISEYLKKPGTALVDLAKGILNTTKSALSTLDNSFFGRQGIKVLYTHPTIWGKNFLKSWGDIGKELIGVDAMHVIKSDVFSRKNALNGKYEALGSGSGLGVLTEEAFPSHFLTKIPGFGRIFKGAESAFNGAALRMRADLADLLIKQAEDAGLDMSKKKVAEPIGNLIGSMTGRGRVYGLTEGGQAGVNATFFSIKFLKSNFDTLTAHRGGMAFEGPGAKFARKQAAINLLKIVGTTSLLLTIAKTLNPNSVQLDPRGTNFGKIMVGKTSVDITGGMSGLVTLAARMVPVFEDGKPKWYYITQAGKRVDLNTGKFGAKTLVDVLSDFAQGKLSPVAGAIRDIAKQQDYHGNVPTPTSVVKGAIAPLPYQTFEQVMQGPDKNNILSLMILDALGFSVNTPNPPKKK